MTNAQLETALRNQFLTMISDMIDTQLDIGALAVSASEIAIPCLDAEGNEKFVLIKVSIPRGTRNGKGGYDPYNGYQEADDYADSLKEHAEKKARAEEKKQAKIARDQKAREEKKALAEANKNLKELRNIKVTPQE